MVVGGSFGLYAPRLARMLWNDGAASLPVEEAVLGVEVEVVEAEELDSAKLAAANAAGLHRHPIRAVPLLHQATATGPPARLPAPSAQIPRSEAASAFCQLQPRHPT